MRNEIRAFIPDKNHSLAAILKELINELRYSALIFQMFQHDLRRNLNLEESAAFVCGVPINNSLLALKHFKVQLTRK